MKLATFFLGCVLSTRTFICLDEYVLPIEFDFVSVVLAQDNVPIYVPFEWDQEPLTATVIASNPGTTTYNLVDGDPMTMTRVVGGPGQFFSSSNRPSV